MADVIQALVLVALTALVGRTAVRAVRDPGHRGDYADVVRHVHWWMVPAGIGMLAAVGATYAALVTLAPWLRWGWWAELGGQGNPVTGGSAADAGTLTILGILAVVMPLLLMAAIPWLALWEEHDFRYGTEHDRPAKVAATSLRFGLIHALVGIPIGAALAITVAGVALHLIYRRTYTRWELRVYQGARDALRDRKPGADITHSARHRALMTVAAQHAVVNWIVVGLLLVVIAAQVALR